MQEPTAIILTSVSPAFATAIRQLQRELDVNQAEVARIRTAMAARIAPTIVNLQQAVQALPSVDQQDVTLSTWFSTNDAMVKATQSFTTEGQRLEKRLKKISAKISKAITAVLDAAAVQSGAATQAVEISAEVRDVLLQVCTDARELTNNGGCVYLRSGTAPRADALGDVSIKANAAYIHVDNELYYVNKTRQQCVRVTENVGEIDGFDATLTAIENVGKKSLTDEQLQAITVATGHTHQELRIDDKKRQLLIPADSRNRKGARMAKRIERILGDSGIAVTHQESRRYEVQQTFNQLTSMPDKIASRTAFGLTLFFAAALMVETGYSIAKVALDDANDDRDPAKKLSVVTELEVVLFYMISAVAGYQMLPAVKDALFEYAEWMAKPTLPNGVVAGAKLLLSHAFAIWAALFNSTPPFNAAHQQEYYSWPLRQLPDYPIARDASGVLMSAAHFWVLEMLYTHGFNALLDKGVNVNRYLHPFLPTEDNPMHLPQAMIPRMTRAYRGVFFTTMLPILFSNVVRTIFNQGQMQDFAKDWLGLSLSDNRALIASSAATLTLLSFSMDKVYKLSKALALWFELFRNVHGTIDWEKVKDKLTEVASVSALLKGGFLAADCLALGLLILPGCAKYSWLDNPVAKAGAVIGSTLYMASILAGSNIENLLKEVEIAVEQQQAEQRALPIAAIPAIPLALQQEPDGNQTSCFSRVCAWTPALFGGSRVTPLAAQDAAGRDLEVSQIDDVAGNSAPRRWCAVM